MAAPILTRFVADPADPRSPRVLSDEFTIATTEGGEIGEQGWNFTNGTWNLINPEANRPGICRRASTAVSGTIASAFTGGGGAVPAIQVDQAVEMTWLVRPVTADADFDLRFGLSSDFTSQTPLNGIYFEKLAADTNWFAVCRASSVQTRVNTGAAFSAGWFNLKRRQISATSMGFTVNGAAEVVVDTNVPAATIAMVYGFHIVPQSANARSVDTDFFSMKIPGTVR